MRTGIHSTANLRLDWVGRIGEMYGIIMLWTRGSRPVPIQPSHLVRRRFDLIYCSRWKISMSSLRDLGPLNCYAPNPLSSSKAFHTVPPLRISESPASRIAIVEHRYNLPQAVPSSIYSSVRLSSYQFNIKLRRAVEHTLLPAKWWTLVFDSIE